MLTPQEISERELVKAVFGGYDIAVVDDFLETISADYAALYKENAILKSKIKVLVEKVEEYRSTEDSMRMEAQEKSDTMVKTAQEESDATLAAAKEEAAKIVADLQAKVSEEESRLAVAQEATAAFIRQSRDLASKISSFLEAVPGLEMKKAPAVEEPAEVVETPAVPDREEEIMDAAVQINEAVTKITEGETDEEPAAAEEIVAEEKPQYDDEGEYTIRPKFDFDNLRFGTNFTEE